MKNIPRILPLVGIAVGGVLAINALAGAKSLPDLMHGAKAFAETAVDKVTPGKDGKGLDTAELGPDGAPKVSEELGPNASVLAHNDAAKPPLACAPSAADLAKEAGLSPAELRILQSLQSRRTELDQRASDTDVQLQLLAAAEAKLDAKIKTLNGLKGDISGLLGQVDTQQAAEIDRMVAVFTAMKAKDAAARMTLLDDSVRLPIAAKMKERTLSMILAAMAPTDAKTLTEKLASRFVQAKAAAEAKQAAIDKPAVAPTELADASDATQKAAAPTKRPAARKPAARKPAAKPKAATAPADPAAAAPATTG
jgi:flagellar motility protein MotE (MotC chaperone)